MKVDDIEVGTQALTVAEGDNCEEMRSAQNQEECTTPIDGEMKNELSNQDSQGYELVSNFQPELSEVPGTQVSQEQSKKLPKSYYAIFCLWWKAHCKKFSGVDGKAPPPMTKPIEAVFSSILAFIGIFLVSLTDYWYLERSQEVDGLGIKMLTGAYAATSGILFISLDVVILISVYAHDVLVVLIYEAYQAPLAQPRNVMGSYLITSFTGVTTRIICDKIGIDRYVTGPLAVFFALFFMNITKTVHPPGGACALIGVIGGPMIENLGYGYMATSFGAAFIMLSVALIGNNLIPSRQYPMYWC